MAMVPNAAIRIQSSDMTQPLATPLPINRASRWSSPYESNGLQPAVSVFMTQPAYSRICVHSVSDMKNEVGGILVGQWCTDEGGAQFVVVEHALPARHTKQGSIYLTFTQDSLVDIHDQIDANYKGSKIVGWYHTHPSMGVFLSHYDTWLHRNFFPEPWQVALVVEPVSAAGGFFVRQKQGSLDPTRYFGFYELDGSYGRSMVYWTNLRQHEDEKGGISQ
jgi:proteasome lid subunit RPN8/RPN11